MMKRPAQESVLQAVRAYCIECSGGSRKAVEACNRQECPLYPYRNRYAAAQSGAIEQPKRAQLPGQLHISDMIMPEGGCKTWAH